MYKKGKSIQSLALDYIENKNNITFSALIKRLTPGLRTFTYKFIQDNDLIKEVLEQTFIALWEKIDQYNNDFNFSTWTYAIARNEALALLRHKKKNVSHDKLTEERSMVLANCSPIFNMDIEFVGPSGDNLVQTLYDVSLKAIEKMDEPYRTVLYEREVNQKQLHIIAEELDWNLNTVKTRLTKARKYVADVIKKEHPELVDAYIELAL
jgi:RNA polymerase sigma-70 factor (ECF subfamily)